MSAADILLERKASAHVWNMYDNDQMAQMAQRASAFPCIGASELSSCLRMSQVVPPLSYSVADLKAKTKDRPLKSGACVKNDSKHHTYRGY